MKHLSFVQSLEMVQGGGLGKSAFDLHSEWLRQGVSSRLLSTGERRDFNDKENYVFQREGPSKLYFSREFMHEAKRFVAESDVVHAHGMHVAPNWIIGGKAIQMNKPLVAHVHGFFEPWILKRSRVKKAIVGFFFEHNNWKHTRLWRALTSVEADQIRNQGIAAPIVVIPNGVNLAEIDSVTVTAPKETYRALFLGRLHPKKGLDILLRAWSKLDSQAGNWELVIAGPDEDGYRETLESIANGMAGRQRIRFIGTVFGVEKIALLRSADLFLLPSYSEGFSVAILEAMACGVPILATEQCNFPQLSESGAGWLCDATEDSLTRNLRHARAALGSEGKDRGRAGRRLIEDSYTWTTIASTLNEATLALAE